MMHYKEFFLFGRRYISIPASAPYALVQQDGEFLQVATNVDDIEADGLLYEALYNESVED